MKRLSLILGIFGMILILLSGSIMVGCKSELEKAMEEEEEFLKEFLGEEEYRKIGEIEKEIEEKLKEGPKTQGFQELRGRISPDSDKRIEVLRHSGKRSWSKAVVEGTVKNITSSSVENIQVRVYFYGASWESLADFPFALEPGETKNFKAEFLGTLADKITSYEIKVIAGPISAAPANFDSWAEAAISWAMNKRGSNEWRNYCLRFVANAFRQRGPEPEGEWGSAREATQNLTLYDEEPQRAPRGSLIFFGKTEDNKDGHVGIYLGNGKLIHAYGKVRIDDVSKVRNLDGGRLIGAYMGWAYPPEKWRPTKMAAASISQTTGNVGAEVTVTGTGFTAGAKVTITYDGDEVASATADSSGAFWATFVIPFGPRGNHSITVTDGTNTKHFIFRVEQ